MRNTIILFLVVSGCAQLTETKNQLMNSLNSNQLEQGEYVDVRIDDQGCMSECTYVKVYYPSLKDYNRPNQYIERVIKNRVSDFIRTGDPNDELRTLMGSFITDYQEFKEAFPESRASWYLDVIGQINYATDNLISFQVSTESYSGGAHTNSETYYYNLDTDGRNRLVKDLITDEKKFTSIAESYFRKQKALSENADLNGAGFIFDDNKFTLSENVGFNKDGALLYYNNYEIAPNSMGPTTLTIPFSEIKDILSFDP